MATQPEYYDESTGEAPGFDYDNEETDDQGFYDGDEIDDSSTDEEREAYNDKRNRDSSTDRKAEEGRQKREERQRREREREENNKNKKFWQKKDKSKDISSPEAMKEKAKQFEMPTIIFPVPCPRCKKRALFFDKWTWNGLRLTIAITLSCFGAIPADKALSTIHFRCMNPRCRSYWVRTGDYMIYGPTKKAEMKKNIFHIDRGKK